jgi:hypothetical protein
MIRHRRYMVREPKLSRGATILVYIAMFLMASLYWLTFFYFGTD